VTPPQQLQAAWSFIENSKGPVKSWTKLNAETYFGADGSSVQLAYQLQCERGTGVARFIVVQENDNWLIQSFNVNG